MSNLELDYIRSNVRLNSIYEKLRVRKYDFIQQDVPPFDVSEVAKKLIPPLKGGMVKYYNTPTVDFIAFCTNMSIHGKNLKFIGDLNGASDKFRVFLQSLYAEVDKKFEEEKRDIKHDYLISFRFPMHEISINNQVRPKLPCIKPDVCKDRNKRFEYILSENKDCKPCWSRVLECDTEGFNCAAIKSIPVYARCNILFVGRLSSLVEFNRPTDNSKGYRLRVECTMAIVVPSESDSICEDVYDAIVSSQEKSRAEKLSEKKNILKRKSKNESKTSKHRKVSYSPSSSSEDEKESRSLFSSSEADDDDVQIPITPPVNVSSESTQEDIIEADSNATFSDLFDD